MTTPAGGSGQQAGRLEVLVVAELSRFAEQLREGVERAARGVEAKVKAVVDDSTLREDLQEAVNRAAAGVEARVKVYVDRVDGRDETTRGRNLRDKVEVGVEIVEGAAREKLRAVIAALQTYANANPVTIRTTVDRDSAAGFLRALLGRLQRQANGAPIDVPIEPGGERGGENRARGRLRRLIDAMRGDVDRDGGGIGVPVDLTGDGQTRLGRSRVRGRRVFRTLRAVFMAGLITLIQPAIAAIGGLVGGLVAMAGAAAPAVNSIGALVPIFTALGAVFGVLKIGFSGFTGDLDKLTPSARKAAEGIRSLKDDYDALKRTIQERLFAEFADDVERTARSVFRVFAPGMEKAATSVGRVIDQLLKMLRSASAVNDLKTIFDGMDGIIRPLGTALVNFVRSFLSFTAAATPAAQRVSRAVQRLSVSFGDMIERGQQTGSIARGLDRALTVASQLGRILKGSFGGLKGIFKAASGAGQSLLDTLERNVDKFNAWANSVQGQNRLKRFFDDMVPVVEEIGRLIVDLVKTLGRMADDPKVVKLLRQIRTELLPALERLFTVLGQTVAPAVIDVISSLATAVSNFAEAGGGLSAVLQALDFLLDLVNDFAAANPDAMHAIATAVGVLFAAALGYRTIRLLGGALGSLVGPLTSLGKGAVGAGLAALRRLGVISPAAPGAAGAGNGKLSKDTQRVFVVNWPKNFGGNGRGGPSAVVTPRGPATTTGPGLIGNIAKVLAPIAALVGARGLATRLRARGAPTVTPGTRNGSISSQRREARTGGRPAPGPPPPPPSRGSRIASALKTGARRTAGGLGGTALLTAGFFGLDALMNRNAANAAVPVKPGALPGVGSRSAQTQQAGGGASRTGDIATVLGGAAAVGLAFAGGKIRPLAAGLRRVSELGRAVPGISSLGRLGRALPGSSKIAAGVKGLFGKGSIAGIAASFVANPVDRLISGDQRKKGGARDVAGGAVGGALQGGSIGAAVGSFVPIVGTAVGAGVGAAVGGVVGGLNRAFPGLSGEVKAKAGALAGVATGAVALLGRKTKVFGFIGTQAARLAPEIGPTLAKVGPAVGGALSAVGRNAGPVVSRAVSAIGTGFGRARTVVGTAIGGVGRVVGSGLSTATTFARTGATRAASAIGTGLGRARTFAGAAVSGVGTVVGTSLRAAGTVASAGASRAAGFIGSGLSRARGFASTAVSGVRGAVAGGLTAAGTAARTGATRAAGFVKTGLDGMRGFASRAADSVSPALRGGLDKARGVAGTAANAASTAVKTGLDKAKGFASTAAGAASTAVGTGLARAKTAASTGANNASQAAKAGFDRAKGFTTTAFNNVRSAVSGGLNNAKAAASTGANNASTAVRTGLSRAKGFATTAFTAVTGAGRTGMSRLKSAVSGGVGPAANALSPIGGRMRSIITRIDLSGAGSRLMSGLARGIRSAGEAAVSAARSIAQRVAGLLPGSPIKWGPLKSWNNGGAGKRLMATLADGISSAGPGVVRAMSGTAGGLAGTLDMRASRAAAMRLAAPAATAGGGAYFAEGAIQVTNPTPEPASTSIQDRLGRVAAFGLFG